MKIFIGWDSRYPICADVLKYSLIKHSTIKLDINYLKLNDLYATGYKRDYDPLASTEFTYTRFLVPYLCNYKGKALFLDSDMLCLSDIAELLNYSLKNYTLRVIQQSHEPTNKIKMEGAIQTNYPRKNWSSFMWMDCSKLQIWSMKKINEASGAYLHRFQDIPNDNIGDLPSGWNHLNFINQDTKIIHYTDGGPWIKNYENHPYADTWFQYKNEMLTYMKSEQN